MEYLLQAIAECRRNAARHLVVDDAALIENVRVGAYGVPPAIRIQAQEPQVPVDVQARQVAGRFKALAPGLREGLGKHELGHSLLKAAVRVSTCGLE